MSFKNQCVVIILCYFISLLFVRGFLYGIKRYQLNNSAFDDPLIVVSVSSLLCAFGKHGLMQVGAGGAEITGYGASNKLSAVIM